MNHTLLRTSVLAIGLLTVSSAVFAHHGSSVYDLKKTTILNGTITNFEWDNPHCLIHIDVKADNGAIERWTLELPSPFTMNRKGWTKDSLKTGDQAMVETHRAKNGATEGISGNSGAIMKVVVNGKALPQ
jgi:hypothetical protein